MSHYQKAVAHTTKYNYVKKLSKATGRNNGR
jgi:hypothetical protein